MCQKPSGRWRRDDEEERAGIMLSAVLNTTTFNWMRVIPTVHDPLLLM